MVHSTQELPKYECFECHGFFDKAGHRESITKSEFRVCPHCGSKNYKEFLFSENKSLFLKPPYFLGYVCLICEQRFHEPKRSVGEYGGLKLVCPNCDKKEITF